jgi:hypothetical protein
VQARLFLRAVREHSFQGKASDELAALGGDFVERAAHNGWIVSSAWRGSEGELQALFVMRWLELTRLRGQPELRPSLPQLRRYYRFLLLYPERGRGVDPPRIERAQLRLRYVEALAQRDRDYPADLARGSLLGELGMTSPSAQALTAHLARGTGAEWTLRARNYLLHAARGRTGP